MSDSAQGRSRLDEIIERGVIRIGCRWAPSAEQYTDPDTSEPSGIVGLLGQQLAKDLGVRVEFVDLTWADHIPALLEDRVDICLKHTNTPSRALVVDFSTGRVLKYEVRAVIRRNSGLLGLDALNQPARRVACGAGSSQVEIVHEQLPRAEMVTFAKTEEALMAVVNRQVDACLADQSIPNFLRLHPECTVLADEQGAPVIFSVDYSHPMIKPGDWRFLYWINNWMDFHQVQGTLDRIKAEAEKAFDLKRDRIMAAAGL